MKKKWELIFLTVKTSDLVQRNLLELSQIPSCNTSKILSKKEKEKYKKHSISENSKPPYLWLFVVINIHKNFI